MSASTPPPPTNGNGKYLLLGIVFLLGIVGLVVWKAKSNPDDKTVNTLPPPSAAPSTSFNQAQVDDVPPPPPEEPDSGPIRKVGTASTANPACDMKHCSGSVASDLETALAFRAKQAHRCYDQALANDTSLQGKVTINVRIAANGAVCAATVGSSDLSSPSVAQCVAGYFRTTGHFPSPKGGCADTVVPISFVPGGR